MILTDEQKGVVRALREASTADFATLVALAGLDPRRDFRHANLRGVDFGTADLAGFDFTGADLTGADLSRARTAGAVFGDVGLDEGVSAELRPYQRQAVEAVIERLRKGGDRAAISMPLGTGKSGVVVALMERLAAESDCRGVLVVAPNRDVVRQLMRRFSSLGYPAERAIFCSVAEFAELTGDDLSVFSHVVYMDVEPDRYGTARIPLKQIVVYSPSVVKWVNLAPKPAFVDSIVFGYEVADAIADGYLAPIERVSEYIAPDVGAWSEALTTCMRRFFLDIASDGAFLGKSVILCDEQQSPDEVVSHCRAVLEDLHFENLVSVSAAPFVRGEVEHSDHGLAVRVYSWKRLIEDNMFGVANVAVLSSQAPGHLSRDWSVPVAAVGRRGTARVYDYTGALSD